MRLVAAILTLLLLTGMAQAQIGNGINLWAEEPKKVDPEAEAKQKEIDRAYKEKLKAPGAPPQPAATDPWGNVRATEKPASQSKAQTGSKSDSKTR
jgi:hypothetical protein